MNGVSLRSECAGGSSEGQEGQGGEDCCAGASMCGPPPPPPRHRTAFPSEEDSEAAGDQWDWHGGGGELYSIHSHFPSLQDNVERGEWKVHSTA